MRLVDLDPNWVTDLSVPRITADGTMVWPKHRKRMGVSWRCPCGCGRRLGVFFANPLDNAVPPAGKAWQREGETFETLTLTPSIDVEGHWHGYITNGEVS